MVETDFIGSKVQLRWTSMADRIYDMEYSDNLESWTKINNRPIQEMQGFTSRTDIDSTRRSESTGYYGVREVTPHH